MKAVKGSTYVPVFVCEGSPGRRRPFVVFVNEVGRETRCDVDGTRTALGKAAREAWAAYEAALPADPIQRALARLSYLDGEQERRAALVAVAIASGDESAIRSAIDDEDEAHERFCTLRQAIDLALGANELFEWQEQRMQRKRHAEDSKFGEKVAELLEIIPTGQR